MREIRNIRDKKFGTVGSSIKRRILFLLIIGAVAGAAAIFTLTKVKTKPTPVDLTSGNIYMDEDQQASGEAASQNDETGETAPSHESFTFYKALKSKEGEIVPLTGDARTTDKKTGSEIKDPQQDKLQRMIEGLDKDLEKRVKIDDFYTVQVAALSNESKANEVMFKLKVDGYTPHLIKEDNEKGRRLYKVRVGRFVSIVDAQDLAKRLKKNGYDTYVIKE